MSVLLALLLPPLVGFFLIILVAIWGTNALTRYLIGKKHRLLDEIINTGEIPLEWRKELAALAVDQRQGTISDKRLQKRQIKARKNLIRKLDQLTHYALTTPLVADEETRQLIQTKLGDARVEWVNRELDQF